MNRIDKFVDDTSFLWFIGLVMWQGFMVWLIVWAVYEILMAFLLTEDKPSKKKKPKKKKPEQTPPAQAPVEEVKTEEEKPEKVYI